VAQRLREELLERVTATRIAADADVGDEERDERVQVARVGSDGVPGRELADLLVGEQPLAVTQLAHACPLSALRAGPLGPRSRPGGKFATRRSLMPPEPRA